MNQSGRGRKPEGPGQKPVGRARWLSRRARRRLTGWLIVVLLVVAGGGGIWWWTAPRGELAPAFALPASTGGTVRLEDYRGKQPVVLVFYMAGT